MTGVYIFEIKFMVVCRNKGPRIDDNTLLYFFIIVVVVVTKHTHIKVLSRPCQYIHTSSEIEKTSDTDTPTLYTYGFVVKISFIIFRMINDI